jgi:FAD/FMN-containing dehydrogenase
MNRRAFLQRAGQSLLLPLIPRQLLAKERVRRRRPSDPDWPSENSWKSLNEEVGGNLTPVDFPLASCLESSTSAGCKQLVVDLSNPYYIGDQPGLTQTLGWVDAWFTKPSVYAVAARNPQHVAAAVRFARDNNLRLVVKGGGHSYQGTSNAPDSLLIWTRRMHDRAIVENFVPQGCERAVAPQRALTCGAGTIWMQAYDSVTTRGGGYVQGGGCATVGVAGLVQSGGFGSFSKRYGTAAAGLLEAEVVTADGEVRIANQHSNPDLFWALKGGGGGSFGVITKLTLRVHELPECFGAAMFRVRASSNQAFRTLLRFFVDFYHDNLFNEHWGETVHISGDNVLGISMLSQGLNTDEIQHIWRPFLDWIHRSSSLFTVDADMTLASMPARHFWDPEWHMQNHQDSFMFDPRKDKSTENVWWKADRGQVGWTIYGYESRWLPASLLAEGRRAHLANALFAASRLHTVELHFNKGLAGAPAEAVNAARQTATNPAVLDAFALAIVADGEDGYPGWRGNGLDLPAARRTRDEIHRSMNELRTLAPNGGAYVSESNYFEEDWQRAYWGSNYPRLAAVKKRYDPTGLFFVHNGVGSDEWSADGFTKL